MTKLTDLIDRAASVCNPSNDSALAARMHVSRSAVSLWRKGGAISEKHLTALIALADVDERTAIEVLAEQAETKPQKAVWNALLQRLGTAAAVVLCAIGFALPVVGKTHELNASANVSGAGDSAHCILCKFGNGLFRKVWRYYWLLLKLLLDRLLHGDGSPGEHRSLEACKSI